jgi:hypothetical protein
VSTSIITLDKPILVGPDTEMCSANILIAVLDETQWGWDGTILMYSGHLVKEEVDDMGRDIGQFDFPVPFPGKGLWVWSGLVATSYEGEQRGNLEFLQGSYRRPTIDELAQLAVNELWVEPPAN